MQIEATGKSVELAIQNGLLECGKKREEVEIKIIENGGLFKKAKVVLSWDEKPTENVKLEEEIENVVENVSNDIEETKNEIETEQEQPTEKKKKVVDTARLEKRGSEFLLGLAKIVDENSTITVSSDENEITFSLQGEKLGKLIGYHGENLQSIQMLLSGLKLRGEWPVRMYVDIDGYKANKNQNLIDLANKTAEQAVKIERNIHLDPMSAYERRIIHTTLQDREDVSTESTGEGEKRHVVVKPIFKK